MNKNLFLYFTAFFYAGLTLVALILNRLLTGTYLPSPVVLSWEAAGLAVAASGLMMAAVWLLVVLDLPFMGRIQEKLAQYQPLLAGLSQSERIYVSVLAGFSEELLFRGVLQPSWGIAVTSVVFGALHAVTFSYFLLATAVSFYLGWLFQYTGNLFVPMAAHALYDIFALNLLAWLNARDELKR
ncbi:hypothetical protein SAMN05660860_01920 [Geoalkalibacter ferrihydriticus]|uniref:CAAX prenyl protease 2/Lysostaphin resistance protein A-like domain-containing protein n=1 Tax=Geoalkalibacter ferrihydriticus TaxID=392333 RepID=A0A1G9QVL4_9BACT|nr:type II CAAX endopeptidase family protein [Geoalkalibacter ferrihydriticus]SDM14911.1 hypothetical protein SAMN05660860_01920 [Geoalkalibacter ferrihydriticus]